MAEQARELNQALKEHALDNLRLLVSDTQLHENWMTSEALEKANIEELDEQITKLQKRKAELQKQLKEMKVKTVKEIVLKELEDKVIQHKEISLPEEVIQKVPLISKKRKLDLLKVTQAICGFSAFEFGEELVLRLESCYEGKYYEHFQIYLKLTKNANLKISHHTIPFFVPLDRIQSAYLNTDLKQFIHLLSDYLNSYVSRRQQVLHLEEMDYVHRLQSSMAADYFTVEVEHENKKYFLQLYYENLLQTFPSKVEIFTLDANRNKTKASHLYPHFLTFPLHIAYTRAFPTMDPGAGSSSKGGGKRIAAEYVESESSNDSSNDAQSESGTESEGTTKGKGKGKSKDTDMDKDKDKDKDKYKDKDKSKHKGKDKGKHKGKKAKEVASPFF